MGTSYSQWVSGSAGSLGHPGYARHCLAGAPVFADPAFREDHDALPLLERLHELAYATWSTVIDGDHLAQTKAGKNAQACSRHRVGLSVIDVDGENERPWGGQCNQDAINQGLVIAREDGGACPQKATGAGRVADAHTQSTQDSASPKGNAFALSCSGRFKWRLATWVHFVTSILAFGASRNESARLSPERMTVS